MSSISGSVQQLENQATTFADSINALDARLTEQEHKTNPRAKMGTYATPKSPEKTPVPAARRDATRPEATESRSDSPARRRVREAMNEFENALPSPAANK